MPLASQSEVSDLQSLVGEVLHLDPLKYEDWRWWWWGGGSDEQGGFLLEMRRRLRNVGRGVQADWWVD